MFGFTKWRAVLPGLMIPVLAVTGAEVATAAPVHSPAVAAQPDSSWCVYPLCSETENDSLGYVLVAHDWCGGAERLSQEAPPCGSGDETLWLAPGYHTDPYEDWDTFRVDGGCVVNYHINYGGSTQVVNRQGRGSQWIRVHDDQTAFIDYDSCWR